MKKIIYSIALTILLMFSVAGCGSGSGESSVFVGGSDPTPAGTAAGSITIAWDEPVGSDGTPLSNVAGYNVYYGTSSGNYTRKVDTNTQKTCTISGLAPGTYYLAVTCYDVAGNESTFSNEASKIVQ